MESVLSNAMVTGNVAAPKRVRKRDGATLQPFHFDKVETAIRKAWLEAAGKVDDTQLRRVTLLVAQSLPQDPAQVEDIQDAVEVALMRHGQFEVAKAFILYRHKRAKLRQVREKPDTAAVSEYIHFSKYAKYIPELRRRELFNETVARVEDMHLRRFAHIPDLLPDIQWAFDQVRDKRVLPSMRSMQFGGRAIEANNNRIYNCSFSLVDRPRVFAEGMYLLLSGCGTGYSVQIEHVEKLPPLAYVDKKQVVHHVVEDTIEGWADALHALVMSYIKGFYLELSYHLIRPAGTPLKTSGGRAPGHLKLKEALEQIRTLLHNAQGRKLRPIECHDIMCFAAEAVLSGGIRRSAMIALFSLEDSEMMYAKTGNWFQTMPWRANANNSVALLRNEVKQTQFKRIFQMLKEWGEPGFFFTNSIDHGTNPCAEIGLYPVLETPSGKKTGWAFCNLCEINAAKLSSKEDFFTAAKAAAIIGTLQASYTSMPYLGSVSEEIAKRDALLGIGMTGMLDSPAIACDPDLQHDVATMVKLQNAFYATLIGINQAARTTCVKPSGTTSLELGCVASGHHPHHARRYIRRVTADELEVVFQKFRSVNPSACIRKPNGKWVIEFPVQAPDGAITKDDVGAVEFLEMVRSTQRNWVLPGTARKDGLNHNVSNTVTVKPDEWEDVAEYIWEHRENFTGISLLAATGDKDFAFAPNEAITTEADEMRWNQLISEYTPVDYSKVHEVEDDTAFSAEAACAGGACLV